MSGAAGQRGIDIVVTVDGGSIVDVSIANHRPLGLASHLIGMEPSEALRQITKLFSICQLVQGTAGCMAIEEALGIDLAPSHKAARELLVYGETVMEHATCALLSWPALLGQMPTGLPALRLIRSGLADLWRAVYPDGDWMRPGGGRLAPDIAAVDSRLAMAGRAMEEAGLRLSLDAGGWRGSLATNGPTTTLLEMLETEAWAGCGISNIPLMRDSGGSMLEQHLASDHDGAYAARPEWQGAARETGPLARRLLEPLVQDMIAEHGLGLASRFFSQAVDTTRCFEEMLHVAPRVSEAEMQPIGNGDGTGLGMVEAARGWLVHRVEIAHGVIRRYQVVAPTEWNFHPRGTFARGLIEGRGGPPPQRLAELMVAALDPCVPCQVTMENHSSK